MSWNVYNKTVAADEANALTDAEIATCETQNPGCTTAVRKAWNAACELCASGAFGDESKAFSVTISGHFNPDNEPVKGWANDCVTINIVQK